MKDFTIQTYKKLLIALHQQGFLFQHFKDFQSTIENQKRIILRHDIDACKDNSIQFAKMEYKVGIVGTYYFRIVPKSFNEKIIKEIAELGHEIGYHYEVMDTCQGDIEKAYTEFCRNLELFRKLVPVVTACMHGSPISKYDNRAIWRKYDYKKLGISAEPYFDVDFSEVLYLTDTGRRWDGGAVNIRDKGLGIRNEGLGVEVYGDWKVKPVSGSLMSMSQRSIDFQNKFQFRSTQNIIKAAQKGNLPDKTMMTFHPQRWTDKPLPWARELVWQNVKNVGKYFIVKIRD